MTVLKVDAMRAFLVRRSVALSHVGAEFAVHIAANYATVSRIQDNARVDLGSSPWLEHVTSVADSRPWRHCVLNGVVVDIDVSPDLRQVAVVTTSAMLYLVSCAATDAGAVPDPVDIGKLSDRVGLCVRFVPHPGAGSSGTGGSGAVFVGSLRQLVAVRGGRPVDSGLDVSSLKLKDRYSIECSGASGGMLAVGLTTLPWGGRSLHIAVWDLQTRKCQTTIEALKFRFGGSAHFGVKAVCLSTDARLVCACVKQSRTKISAWNSTTGEEVASVDVDDEISRCAVFTVESRTTLVLSAAWRASADSSSKSGKRCYVWTVKETSLKPLTLDRWSDCSLVNIAGQTAVVAQWNRAGSPTTLSLWYVVLDWSFCQCCRKSVT